MREGTKDIPTQDDLGFVVLLYHQDEELLDNTSVLEQSKTHRRDHEPTYLSICEKERLKRP